MWVLAGACLLFALLPIATTFLADHDKEFWAKVLLVVGFGCAAVYCFGEAAFVRGTFDESGIEFVTPWTGRKREKWPDLVSIDFSNWAAWYVLKFTSGRKIRLSTYLGGHEEALEMALLSAKRSLASDRGSTSPVSFERQVSVLASCGIRLAPGVMPEALLASHDRADFEADPYRLLLTCMGGEAESGPHAGVAGYLSDDIWHFDTECIEHHGDYAAISRRLRDLAQGDLPLEDITDHVDVGAGVAKIGFRLAGQSHRWAAKVENDWVDPDILSRFAVLLTKAGSSRRFTCIGLDGQDCLIGCATPEDRQRLAKETGLTVEWLE